MFKKEWASLTLAALSAFCVYTCMYAFRKPFTAANFSSSSFLSIDYKVWLVIAQTIGYTLSKFYGIKFIAELKTERRPLLILSFIGAGWVALFFFAVTPAPFNILFLLLNGFALGVIYGLVFSYLEGRRSTELLGAVLATSFIFASGFTQSVGKYILLHWNVSEWWMPFVTGAVFLIPTIIFTLLLDKTPRPNAKDIEQRTQRLPMTREERKLFIRTFFPGLVMLIITYILLTVIRDYRSNFASNIWAELGEGNNAAVFTQSELPASLVTLFLLGMLVLIKNNRKALMINHLIIAAGFLLSIFTTVLYQNGTISAFWWMTIVGVGMYMGYVPFNAMLFERLIASFKYVSNAGFLIYLADSFGYLGSDAVLLVKSFMKLNVSWTTFFATMVLVLSSIGIVLITLSALYFRAKFLSTKIKTGGLSYV
jgi:MFS family permease